MVQTAKNSAPNQVRIVTLSSIAHGAAPKGGINFKDINGEQASGLEQYGQSKLANLLMSKELDRRYRDQGIISLSLHPGLIRSDLWTVSGTSFFQNIFLKLICYDIAHGVLSSLYAGTSEAVMIQDGGKYLVPWARFGKPLRKEADDPALAKRLWDWCEEAIKKA